MTPDPTARLRLDVALDQLLNPERQQLDRDRAAARQQLDQLDAAHLDTIRDLARRHRDAAKRKDKARMRRAIDRMTRAGHDHRTRRAQLAARLDVDTAEIPPLLDRLVDAVTSTSGAGNGARGVHRSPLNTTAVEVLADIAATVAGRYTGATLADRLRTWRPEDVEVAADKAERWTVDARAIVTPARWTEAKRPCPACGNRHVWVTEDGSRIRKAAIQVNLTDGYAACIAASCGAWWPRERFDLLAAALSQDDVAS